ncbi:hypothetical protein [Terasakiella pusilla]|uniref:hypothetical protein n=1 Tax=Terasakiella pusilla TaxID=64973 RepID=UPI000571DB2C|nr:hypothetical protein [Terasakiella pusilla]
MDTVLPTGITPRMLNEEAAAFYMNLDQKSFRKLVNDGRLPEPLKFNGVRRNLYDRKKLDAFLDSISGLAIVDGLQAVRQ